MDGSAVYTIEVRPTRREYFQLWILFLFPLEISPSRSVFFKWKSQLSWSSLQSEVWCLRSLYCTSEAQSSSSKLHRCSHLSAPGATLQEQYLKPRVCFQQRSYLARRKQSLMMWWRGEKEKRLLLQNFEGKHTNCHDVKGMWLKMGSNLSLIIFWFFLWQLSNDLKNQICFLQL